MNIKVLFLPSWLLLLMSLIFSNSVSLKAEKHGDLCDLRHEYVQAVYDYSNAAKIYQKINTIKELSAKEWAYKGALEAILTKTQRNLIDKISLLRKSHQSLNTAVNKNPNDIEIRFLRMAVQYEIPWYLGLSNNLKEDQRFIESNINQFNPENYSRENLQLISGFIEKYDSFTDSQVKIFTEIINGNAKVNQLQ